MGGVRSWAAFYLTFRFSVLFWPVLVSFISLQLPWESEGFRFHILPSSDNMTFERWRVGQSPIASF